VVEEGGTLGEGVVGGGGAVAVAYGNVPSIIDP